MSVQEIPIRGGRIEALHLPGGPGIPLLVLGGVETGLRRLAGTEHVLEKRWARRTERRPVVIVGRPLPDDGEVDRLMHPRVIADAVAAAIEAVGGGGGPEPPYAIEAESGGGRISLWLTVDHPELVSRLVLSSVASETRPDDAMAHRMAQWIELAENDDWGMFFGHMAVQMKPAESAAGAASFDAAARLQPRPATPERFVAELRATLDPSSFVTDRLGEIHVPALILAGERDQVVPPEATRLVAEHMPQARFASDPECGHTVRSSFEGYHDLVEAFLAEGDGG
ncbi:MAG TPA: alpha/beta fold hydrolase [Candidatus Limnocylindria bacterium]